jgi:hypothetical protein
LKLPQEQGSRGRFGCGVILGGVACHVAGPDTLRLEIIGKLHELTNGRTRFEKDVGHLQLCLFDSTSESDLALAGQKRSRGDLTEIAVDGVGSGTRGARRLDGVHDGGGVRWGNQHLFS